MVAALVESLVFVSASGYHGRVMYGSFKRMKNDSSIETGGGRSKKMNVISSNLYSLGLQSIVSSVIGATHFTVSVILAFFPVHDPTLVGYVGVFAISSLFVMLGLHRVANIKIAYNRYMIAIFGGATYGLIFIRTIASSRNNTPTPSTANPSFVQSRTGPYLSSRSNDVSPGSARPFQIESFDHINELEMEPVFLKEKDDVDSKEILRVV
jgi:Na+-transporting NADH:ubiquinone oxidoreductase subunit NqrB